VANQNGITLSATVTQRSFLEEWGGKGFIKLESATQKSLQEARKREQKQTHAYKFLVGKREQKRPIGRP
jgi:hypothetical protein